MMSMSIQIIIKVYIIFIYLCLASNCQNIMSLLNKSLNLSLNKIISQCQQFAQSPKIMLSSRRRPTYLNKLQSIKIRKLQPVQIYKKQDFSISTFLKKSFEDKPALKKMYSLKQPKNASKSRQSNYNNESVLPARYSLIVKKRKQINRFHTQPDDHLSYQQLVKKRQQQDQGRRLVILKQVIQENVKRKNQEMRIKSRKKIKTIY